MELKKQLENFFQRLKEPLETGAIQSEEHIASLVRIEDDAELALWKVRGIVITEGNETLLEILGFRAADVEDHPPQKTIIGTTRYVPDYILKHSHRRLAVIDLKAPDVSLDNECWTEQIVSYCEKLEAPLGILFNGRAIRVFVNPKVKGLTRYRDDFSNQPVASADEHNIRQMIEILSSFSSEKLQKDPVEVARIFAKKRKMEIDNTKRHRQILEKLRELLSNPPPELLAAVASLQSLWDDVQPVPSANEVIKAWEERSLQSNTTLTKGGGSINAQLREAVAEVIRNKGIDAIYSAKISGLRHRDIGGNGYIKVHSSSDIHPPLFVQGVPTEDAKRIINDLKKLAAS